MMPAEEGAAASSPMPVTESRWMGARCAVGLCHVVLALLGTLSAGPPCWRKGLVDFPMLVTSRAHPVALAPFEVG